MTVQHCVVLAATCVCVCVCVCAIDKDLPTIGLSLSLVQVIGSPSEEDLMFISSEKARRYIRSLPKHNHVDFRTLYPHGNELVSFPDSCCPPPPPPPPFFFARPPPRSCSCTIRFISPPASTLHLNASFDESSSSCSCPYGHACPPRLAPITCPSIVLDPMPSHPPPRLPQYLSQPR